MAQTLKGMRDLMGRDVRTFQRIEAEAHRLFAAYGYEEIRTPLMEATEVFARSVGESSDIVHKEMYTFTDRGDRSVTLRPENTASVVRAMVEHKLLVQNDPRYFYYIGPMFRYERPQAGRYRQFWQIGAEVFGVPTPEADAESLLMLYQFLQGLGLKKLIFSINNVGTPESRPAFNQAFRDFFMAQKEQYCPDCLRRIDENPLRVLDCKIPACQAALVGHPLITEYLDDASRSHFERLKELMTRLNLPFEENPRLVRGLDYYTKTVFEVLSADLGAHSAILGGGRYDGLVKQLGGPAVPGFGWAIGLDRLATLVMQLEGEREDAPASALLIPMGDEAMARALELARIWRDQGCCLRVATEGKALKKALQTCDRQKIPVALILGDDELARQEVMAKDLASGTQEAWTWSEVVNRLRGAKVQLKA